MKCTLPALSLGNPAPRTVCHSALSELLVTFQRNIFISSWVTQEPNSCFKSNLGTKISAKVPGN